MTRSMSDLFSSYPGNAPSSRAMSADVAYDSPVRIAVNAALEANFRYAAKDEPQDGEEDPNTGGSVLYLSPRVVIRIDPKVSFRLGLQVPLVKDLYGDQDEKVNLLTGFAVRF